MAQSGHGSISVCILTGVCIPYPQAKVNWIGLWCPSASPPPATFQNSQQIFMKLCINIISLETNPLRTYNFPPDNRTNIGVMQTTELKSGPSPLGRVLNFTLLCTAGV